MARSKKVTEKPALVAANRAKDEMNLAEFPFCQLSDKLPKSKVLSFSYDSLQDDGTIIRREWRIEGGAECGLPRPIDEDVYVGLMLLTSRQGFESQKVTFTIYELLDVLGWDKGGRSYSRIRASLRRLRNLSIEAVNAFKDNQTKRYEKFLGFGIIDDYEINTGAGGEFALPFDDTEVSGGKSYIRWNTRLFRSFKDGYIKNLDQEFYRSLKSTISKRLYRFLDKKFYFGGELTIDVLQLGYEHIGLSRQSGYPSKVWEKLMGGVAELKERNYLAAATRNGKSAAFVRASGPLIYAGKKALAQGGKDVAREMAQQLLDELRAVGVSARQGQRFIDGCSGQQVARALNLVGYFREVIWPRTQERLKNPAGYLLTLLRDESFQLPGRFIAARASGDSPQMVAKLQREIEQYRRLDEIGEREFAKLSAAERDKRIDLRITEMMLSKHRAIYQSWPKDLLREQAAYQVKKTLAGKLIE